MTLSPLSFRKRYESSYETPSSSASPASSLTLPPRKRYRGTSEPILDTKTKGDESKVEGTGSESEDSEDEGLDSKIKEAASKDQQQQAVPVEDTSTDEPLGFGYGAARRRALELEEGPMPSTFEVGQRYRSLPDQQRVDETPTPRLPTCPTWVDPEDGTIYIDIEFDAPLVRAPIQAPALPEWSSGSLLVSPASLTVPPPIASPVTTPAATLEVDEDDFLEVGAQLELYERQTDAQRAALWQARYEDQRDILTLRMQHAADQRDMQELRERVATLERRMDRVEG
ncbi:hypothetical protein Tco_0450138 [Tanacetum coccineum]